MTDYWSNFVIAWLGGVIVSSCRVIVSFAVIALKSSELAVSVLSVRLGAGVDPVCSVYNT